LILEQHAEGEQLRTGFVQGRADLLPVAPESWAIYYAKRAFPALVEALLARDVA
jgi:hypothetical protein